MNHDYTNKAFLSVPHSVECVSCKFRSVGLEHNNTRNLHENPEGDSVEILSKSTIFTPTFVPGYNTALLTTIM